MDEHPTPPADNDPRTRYQPSRLSERRQNQVTRRRRILFGGALVASMLSLALIIWLFSPGETETEAPPGIANLERIDGTLLVAENDELVMRPFEPFEGQEEITFVVNEANQKNFDLAHLRSHSAIGLPTRVFFRRQGDQLIAVYKEDAPANSAESD
ncbi:MAG: hypothetical protein QG596_1030 [Actinomycetota bacterium]|jgi:hypothetical protein|nr:hypothetical protein [Actinomycetota bacterium]